MHLAARQTWLRTPQGTLSAADMLQVLLGMEPQVVDGPATRIASTYSSQLHWRRRLQARESGRGRVQRANQRLPDPSDPRGAEKLSPLAATLAADDGASADVDVRRANLEFEKDVSNEPQRSYNWPIHPEGFGGARAA